MTRVTAEKSSNVSSNSEKLNSAIKKVMLKKARKAVNSSLEGSFGAIRRKRRNKMKDLHSKSFVMRQASAIEAKNRVFAYEMAKVRQCNAELERRICSLRNHKMMMASKILSYERKLREMTAQNEELKQKAAVEDEELNSWQKHLYIVLNGIKNVQAKPHMENIGLGSKTASGPRRILLDPMKTRVGLRKTVSPSREDAIQEVEEHTDVASVGSDVESVGSDVEGVGSDVESVGSDVVSVGSGLRKNIAPSSKDAIPERDDDDVASVGSDVESVGSDVVSVGSSDAEENDRNISDVIEEDAEISENEADDFEEQNISCAGNLSVFENSHLGNLNNISTNNHDNTLNDLHLNVSFSSVSSSASLKYDQNMIDAKAHESLDATNEASYVLVPTGTENEKEQNSSSLTVASNIENADPETDTGKEQESPSLKVPSSSAEQTTTKISNSKPVKARKSKVPKARTLKERVNNKKKKGKERKGADDPYDFLSSSSDSFVCDPNKTIKLNSSRSFSPAKAQKINSSHRYSDPGTKENEEPARRSSRRRADPVCYVEPSLNSKLRRCDRIADNSLFSTFSPKRKDIKRRHKVRK